MRQILKRVRGYADRYNDLIYCPPLEKCETRKATIYFGGDIQDFAENMTSEKMGREWMADKDNKDALQWNLDNTATIFQNSFPKSHIIVIRPFKIEHKTFSCFTNFVSSNSFGVPHHTSTNNGLLHLKLLLDETIKLIRKPDLNTSEEKDLEECSFNPEKFQLTLVGFSKGCVVLNQFLYEFHYYTSSPHPNANIDNFMKQVKEMFWLDGGHSGGKNTWITESSILKPLSELEIKVHVHVTPYQVHDKRRPWIGMEQNLFTHTLRDLGVNVYECLYFPNDPPDLLHHFKVLNTIQKDS